MEYVNKVSGAVVDAAITVHKEYGPGLLERVYVAALASVLRRQGYRVHLERYFPVYFDGRRIDCAFRVDMVVDDVVLVEVKSVHGVHPIHRAQVLTYLRHSGIPVGLLLNFREPLMRTGIQRFVGPAALTVTEKPL